MIWLGYYKVVRASWICSYVFDITIREYRGSEMSMSEHPLTEFLEYESYRDRFRETIHLFSNFIFISITEYSSTRIYSNCCARIINTCVVCCSCIDFRVTVGGCRKAVVECTEYN